MIPIDQKEIYRSNNKTDLKMIEVGVKALEKQQALIDLYWSHQTLLRRSMPRFAVKGSNPAGNLKGVKCEDFTPFIIY